MEAPGKQQDDKGRRGSETGQNRQDESNKVDAEGKKETTKLAGTVERTRAAESKSLERFSSCLNYAKLLKWKW